MARHAAIQRVASISTGRRGLVAGRPAHVQAVRHGRETSLGRAGRNRIGTGHRGAELAQAPRRGGTPRRRRTDQPGSVLPPARRHRVRGSPGQRCIPEPSECRTAPRLGRPDASTPHDADHGSPTAGSGRMGDQPPPHDSRLCRDPAVRRRAVGSGLGVARWGVHPRGVGSAVPPLVSSRAEGRGARRRPIGEPVRVVVARTCDPGRSSSSPAMGGRGRWHHGAPGCRRPVGRSRPRGGLVGTPCTVAARSRRGLQPVQPARGGGLARTQIHVAPGHV